MLSTRILIIDHHQDFLNTIVEDATEGLHYCWGTH